MQVLGGTGCLDYYTTKETDKLRAYSEAFKFVEVNSTFCNIPRLDMVRSWRRRVPSDFFSSVKCNGLATHVHRLRPVDETFSVLKRMLMVCRMLLSDMLILQTPASLRVDESKVREVSDILKNLEVGQVRVFWEARASSDSMARRIIREEMLQDGIIPIMDLSREAPPESEVVYSRLFSLIRMLNKNDIKMQFINTHRVILNMGLSVHP